MDHTHIVQAGDLDRYAPSRDSQAVVPELVYWLVRLSCPDVVCRIPYGESISQSGMDGSVETELGFDGFIPKGKSYWEIGTDRDPQRRQQRSLPNVPRNLMTKNAQNHLRNGPEYQGNLF